MTKEEAIEILSDIRAEYNIFSDDEEEATRYHALSWAIRALNEQQPDTPTDTPTDTISRQSAIDAVGINTWAGQRLLKVPSAQRKGKWIYLNGLDAFECSVCGRQMVRNIFDYCPWCGAEMTKGEEDE